MDVEARCRRRFGIGTFLWSVAAGLVFASASAHALAEESPVSEKGFQLQPLDEPALPLKPVVPRSPEEAKRIEASAWFMAGNLFETRLEWKRAAAAYLRASEADPKSAMIFRKLMQLALIQDEPDKAMTWAFKVVELDPADYEVLHTLAVSMAANNRGDDAIKYLEQAISSPTLDKHSFWYVRLTRDLGILYLATGNLEKAAPRYAALLDVQEHPENYTLDPRFRSELLNDPRTNYEKIAQVLLDAKMAEPAERALALAVKTGKASTANLNYNRASLKLLQGHPDEALTELRKYLDAQKQSKGKDAYKLLAAILDKLGRNSDLIPQLKDLAEKDPRNATLQYFLADQLVDAGEYTQAESIYEASLKGTRDVQGLLGLARLYRKQKDANKLLDVLGRGLSHAPPESLGELEKQLEEIQEDKELSSAILLAAREQAKVDPRTLTFEEAYLAAKIAAEIKQIDEAVSLYHLAMEIDKDRAPLVYSDLVELLMKQDRYADAVKVIDQALSDSTLASKRVNFLFLMSQAKEMTGDTAGALEAINDAIRIVPSAALLQFQLGWIYFHNHQFEEAVEQFEKVIEKFPQDQRTVRQCQFSLSNIHVLQGDYDKGEKILEEVYKEDPEDVGVNNDLGYLYADHDKNLEQAEKMIRKAVTAEPKNASYLDSLGWVLFKRGDAAEAAKHLEEAVQIRTGGDGTIHGHLGDVYEKLGRVPDARSQWAKAIELGRKERFPDQKLLDGYEAKMKATGGLEIPKNEAASQPEAKPAESDGKKTGGA